LGYNTLYENITKFHFNMNLSVFYVYLYEHTQIKIFNISDRRH